MGSLGTIKSGEVSGYSVGVTFEVRCQPGLVGSKLTMVGDTEALGRWKLEAALQLRANTGHVEGDAIIFRSDPVTIPITRFPLHYKYVANGHRVSPTTRPLIWDLHARTLASPPAGRIVYDNFEPTSEDSDTGWVTAAGMGALQLRVGQPPGSTEPLVVLSPEVQQPFEVHLTEAHPGDPNVPQGKTFAIVELHDMGYAVTDCRSSGSGCQLHSATYLMNGQALDALAFRVDVVTRKSGALIARAFISAASLAPLEGHISASLMTPGMQFGGTFLAKYLVVTATQCVNDLSNVQRVRWSPPATPNSALDIGHRGSGATKVKDHHVRENTILSFLKAATNHSDFIEFDVHVTLDGEVVVHHDFDVKLAVGNETVKMGISQLTYKQLQSSEFTSHMSVTSPSELKSIERLGAARQKQNRTFKRHMSSGEDMLRSSLYSMTASPPKPDGPISTDTEANGQCVIDSPLASHLDTSDYASWCLPDRIATLREALRRTPSWLGFNIELKFPTDAELQAMACRFYSRNYFVDCVLKVLMEEDAGRKIIFSSFDPDVATLLRLKQPRFPVFFLTWAGTKSFSDPRMASLNAALTFAKSSQLQGVVPEISGMAHCLDEVVRDCHDNGLFIFSWGAGNNDPAMYNRQKAAGIDAVILDDVVKMTKASGKKYSLFNQPLKSPTGCGDSSISITACAASPLATASSAPAKAF